MTIFSLALTFFLIANPIGCAPLFLALVKDYDFERQKKILLREGLFSLFLVFFFLFIGEVFLSTLQIEQYSVQIGGGVLLFLVSMSMIFPHPHSVSGTSLNQEPFIVPIATPLISGGGIFTTVIVYLKRTQSYLLMSEAILVAWAAIIGVMYFSSYFQKLLGKSGLAAMEQLMGMLLMMLSVELMAGGTHLLIKAMHI